MDMNSFPKRKIVRPTDKQYRICSYVAKYEDFFGCVESGLDIHHIDGNRKNDSLENLVAIPISLHKKYHQNEREMFSCFNNKNQVGFIYHASVLTKLYGEIMSFKNASTKRIIKK